MARCGKSGRYPSPDAGDIRTDLAIEAREALQGDVPGVSSTQEKLNSVTITRVDVQNEAGARLIGKMKGMYITVECPELKRRDRDLQDEVKGVLVGELKRLLPQGDYQALVVGLGNWNATPDALGPRTVNKLLVTRHIMDMLPFESKKGLRPVAAIAPGVLGITGIETGEVIRGVVDHVNPSVVILVDALAARDISRMLTTIQLTNTGIQPGSGVGSDRMGITSESLSRPVIAIGVPTVVHATTVANDTLDMVLGKLEGEGKTVPGLSPDERRKLIQEVLAPSVGDLTVTPKEIDAYVEDMAGVIAGALNEVLHDKSELSQELERHLL